MMVINSMNGKASSISAGLMWGIAASASIMLLLAAAMAIVIETGNMSWESVGYGIMAILFVSSFAGAKVAYNKIKRQYLMVSVMFATVYIGVLLAITALFFGGQYHGVGVTTILVFGGSVTSALLRGGDRKRGNGAKIKIRTR